tara:strand:- start:169 stop:1122 length:954 start_codon:yes stop_codon:yes gene_type:complete
MEPVALTEMRDLFVSEIRAVDPHLLDDTGLWFGIDQAAVTSEPPFHRKPDRPLLKVFDQSRWKQLLVQFETLGFAPPKNLIVHDGVADNFCVESYDLLPKSQCVVVRYWAIEIADNQGEAGAKGAAMEPRAQLLCRALTGHEFEYPYHFIFAQVVRMTPQEDRPRSVGPGAEKDEELKGFAGLKKGFFAALPDVAPARASRGEEMDAISAAAAGEDVAPPPAQAEDEEKEEKEEKEEETPETPEPEPEPELEHAPCEPEGHKIYFPCAEYIYPDGSVREIPAGMYTQDDFIARTMAEVDRLAESKADRNVVATASEC